MTIWPNSRALPRPMPPTFPYRLGLPGDALKEIVYKERKELIFGVLLVDF